MLEEVINTGYPFDVLAQHYYFDGKKIPPRILALNGYLIGIRIMFLRSAASRGFLII